MPRFKNFDEYIENPQPFEQPILTYFRDFVQEDCSDYEEAFKWNFPNFMHRGSILWNMSAFTAHTTFGFWLDNSMKDPEGILQSIDRMGHFGKLKSMDVFPSKKVIIACIQHAIELTDQGLKHNTNKEPKPELAVPEVFRTPLVSNRDSDHQFNNFSKSNRNEYVEWITDAKTDNTRDKRSAQAIEWISEGNPRK